MLKSIYIFRTLTSILDTNKYFVISYFLNKYFFQINLVGETVNLMAIDSGRLEMLAQNVNTIWSAPLQTGLSLYFLWTYLGISALAGLIVMILLIPVNAILSRQMRKYQIDNMKNKDTRIKVSIDLPKLMTTLFPNLEEKKSR